MPHASFKDESRKNYGRIVAAPDDARLTTPELMVGCAQRMAASLEKIEQPYQRLISDLEWYKRRDREKAVRIERLGRSNAALRGVITKLKKARVEQERDSDE